MQINTVGFDYRIRSCQLSLFRGAISSFSEYSDIFHNHLAEGVNYRYPKIQYKRLNGGFASIVGIDEGADALMNLIGDKKEICVTIGTEHRQLKVGTIERTQHELHIGSYNDYKIVSWLPLNSENYREYLAKGSLVERISMLESILRGNILSFAKGVGTFFDSRIECYITDLEHAKIVKYKDVELMEFDAQFRTNVSLPSYIGLGKLVSLGHGTITSTRK